PRRPAPEARPAVETEIWRMELMRLFSFVEALVREAWFDSDYNLSRILQPAGFLEAEIANPIFAPVLVIEVPPFDGFNGETFVFHRVPEQTAVPALQRRPARIVGKRAVGSFIVRPDHFHGLSGVEVIQGQ